MALKDIWVDIVDGQDDVLAEDINSIAGAVIDNEDAIIEQRKNKQDKLTDEQLGSINDIPGIKNTLNNKVTILDAFGMISIGPNEIEGKKWQVIYLLDSNTGNVHTEKIPAYLSDLTDDIGIGDIDTALDSIIAIQNGLIGGDSV